MGDVIASTKETRDVFVIAGTYLCLLLLFQFFLLVVALVGSDDPPEPRVQVLHRGPNQLRVGFRRGRRRRSTSRGTSCGFFII